MVQVTPQTAYVHPVIDGKDLGYFDWLGAAVHTSERRSSAMHGKPHLLEAMYAGVDEANLYCRLDFAQTPKEWPHGSAKLLLGIESARGDGKQSYRLESQIADGQLGAWVLYRNGSDEAIADVTGLEVALESIFEGQIPLGVVGAARGSTLGVRFSLWHAHLRLHAMPPQRPPALHPVAAHALRPVSP